MKNKYSILILIISGLLLQGCIAKKYVRPEVVPEKSAYRGATTDTVNFADITWSEYYKDPNLVALINYALDSNFDIRIAESNIRAAQEYLKQSKAAFYPTVMGGVSAGVHAYTNENGNLGAMGNYSLLFQTMNNGSQVSWEIDLWGKLASAKRSQQAKLMESETYYNAVKTGLVANIAAAYYTLLAYDAQLKIYETTAATREESVEVLQSLKNSAQANDIAVNQGTAQYYYALTQIPQLKIRIQTTENLISILLGKTPGEIKRGNMFDEQFADVDFLKIGIPGQLLANRPDVLAAEYQLISAHEQWNYARAAMYPSLVLSADVGFESSKFLQWFAFPASFVGDLIGGLTAPIFANRKLKTQRNVALEGKIQAALQFEKVVGNAQKEIADAYITYLLSNESIGYQTKQVSELNNAVNGSWELMKSGYSSYLDLLYAEENALSAAIGLVEIHLQNANAKIELYRALGGGWK